MATFLTGQIILTGFTTQLPGWALCTGDLLPISENQALFDAIGNRFGGDGVNTFALPNLCGSVPIGVSEGGDTDLSPHPLGSRGGQEEVALTIEQVPSHAHDVQAYTGTAINPTFGSDVFYAAGVDATHNHYVTPKGDSTGSALHADSIAESGGGKAHGNIMPTIGMAYWICLSTVETDDWAYVGQIDWFPYGYVPYGYFACDGTAYLAPALRNEALFAVIGTTFGQETKPGPDGEPQFFFKVPNMAGSASAGVGQSPGGQVLWKLGSTQGTMSVDLSLEQYPAHSHDFQAMKGTPDANVPSGKVAFGGFIPQISPAGKPSQADTTNAKWLNPVGGGQAHENMQPYLVLIPAICADGAYPFGE